MSRTEGEGFLARWSRRKAQESEPEDRQPVAEEAQPETETETGAPSTPESEAPAEPLPDPETLGRDADWTRFLKRDVPAELRVKALRRLWRLDPVYANLDGLVDYAEDYNGPQFTGKPVKTLFKVGRGMLVDTPASAKPEAVDLPQASAADSIAEGAPAAESPAAEGPAEEGTVAEGPAAPLAPADAAPESANPKTATPEPAQNQSGESSESRENDAPPAARKARHGRSALSRRWGAVGISPEQKR